MNTVFHKSGGRQMHVCRLFLPCCARCFFVRCIGYSTDIMSGGDVYELLHGVLPRERLLPVRSV